MHVKVTSALLLCLLVVSRGWAAENEVPSAQGPTFLLPPIGNEAKQSLFSEAQLTFVQNWIKQRVPECPLNESAAAAGKFLEELQLRYPDKLEQLLTAEFPAKKFESTLLRQVGQKLSGAAQAPLREVVARRRVEAMLETEGRDPKVVAADATGLMVKIKEASPVQYRRLLEGRTDDEDLQFVILKTSQDEAAPKVAVPVKPKVLTAADIVSEFSRRNQAGSALQRLQAYTVEGRLKPAEAEEQEILFFKMKPASFRLVVRSGGITNYTLAGGDGSFWQLIPGKKPQVIPAEALGQRRYLSEFIDPLFVGEGYIYDRLEDGGTDENKFYRIAVRRNDGSGYVARVDQENFREIGRENADKSVVSFTDFREVAGMTFAFREESTDEAGRKAVFTLARITPNPGLLESFFTIPAAQEMGYFALERILAPVARTNGKSN